MHNQNIKCFVIAYQGQQKQFPLVLKKTGNALSTSDVCYPVNIRQTVITDSLVAGYRLSKTCVEHVVHWYDSVVISSVTTVFALTNQRHLNHRISMLLQHSSVYMFSISALSQEFIRLIGYIISTKTFTRRTLTCRCLPRRKHARSAWPVHYLMEHSECPKGRGLSPPASIAVPLKGTHSAYPGASSTPISKRACFAISVEMAVYVSVECLARVGRGTAALHWGWCVDRW